VMSAKDDMTYHVKDNLELEQLLLDHLGNVPLQKDRRLRESVEFSLAGILCLLCVTGIWMGFARGLETLINLNVPIEYMNRSAEMEIMDTSDNSVNLILGGSGTLIKSLTSDNVKVKIDLVKAIAGVNTFTLTQENVVLPPGIILKNIDPAVVEVTLDLPEQKVLPVQVDWAGKLKENLRLESVSVEPERVTLVGGRLQIENISTIYTKKVLLNNIENSGNLTVNLALHPPGLKFANDQEEKVVVRYTVKKRLIK
jgi:diadenylate cyclase